MINLFKKLKRNYQKRGLLKTLQTLFIFLIDRFFVSVKTIWNYIIFISYYNLRNRNNSFNFKRQSFWYFYHPYNTTWKNERAVEIPIIWSIVERAYVDNKRVLELGNVLSHYFRTSHDIVDLYEKGERVINNDILQFFTNKQYDLIVSISTIEHVGWDCGEKLDPRKPLVAINRLKKFLAKNGLLIITFPLGYNPNTDALLKQNVGTFSDLGFLKRISYNNEWGEVDYFECINSKYNKSFPCANAIAIGTFYK